jgi:phosphoglycolate phosphatase-like HAD superfamily hydrolase
MVRSTQKILALDFDGVICDGLREYFQSTVKTYQRIWQDLPNNDLSLLERRFSLLRPVVETGWEMPVLLRAIVLNITDPEIFQNWSNLSLEILNSDRLEKIFISKQLDLVRDSWIETNLDEWLDLHQLYPQTQEKLQAILTSSIDLYIITTKTARFVTELLQKYRVILPEGRVIGKEAQRPKHESLRRIIAEYNSAELEISFIEDRLNTLLSVKERQELDFVNLYLADWGYNTAEEREFAQRDDRIQLISLSQFQQLGSSTI